MSKLWLVNAVLLLSLFGGAWAESSAEILESDEQPPKKEESKLPLDATVESEDTPQVKKLPLVTNEDISPLLAKAISKEKRGKKPKETVALYQQVVTAEPENAAAFYRLGIAMVRNEQLLDGAAMLEQALQLKPGHPKYLCDYGLAALRIGWLEKAAVACQTAALAVPAEARFQSALGDCQLAARRLNDAADSYKRAINLTKGRNPDYIYNLGLTHLYAHAFKKAIEIFNEVIAMRGDYSPYYCSRGLAYENIKNIKQAIADYCMALNLNKDDAYAHFLLAGTYSNPDDPTYTNKFEAVTHAEKAVKLSQYKNAQYLMGLSRALRVAHNYDQASAIAKKAIAIDPREDYKQELVHLEQMKMPDFRK
ncbi:MAG: tetratricopeptide repeat protein [Planctomycetota bacterium]